MRNNFLKNDKTALVICSFIAQKSSDILSEVAFIQQGLKIPHAKKIFSHTTTQIHQYLLMFFENVDIQVHVKWVF